jgi:hypothetical protein
MVGRAHHLERCSNARKLTEDIAGRRPDSSTSVDRAADRRIGHVVDARVHRECQEVEVNVTSRDLFRRKFTNVMSNKTHSEMFSGRSASRGARVRLSCAHQFAREGRRRKEWEGGANRCLAMPRTTDAVRPSIGDERQHPLLDG